MTSTVGVRTHKSMETAQSVAASQVKVAAGSRMFFVDNLRVFLTIMVVIFHLSITYGADASWFYKERPTTELAGILLTLFVILNQFYFMGLFFLISGYFVPGSVDRKGSIRYTKDRLIRLGIPLVLYSLLISPFVEYVKGVTVGYYTGGLGQFYFDRWQHLKLTPGPLWFVEVLLVFSLVYITGKAFLDWVNRKVTRSNPKAIRKPINHCLIIAFILVLAPLSFATRLIIPIGVEWKNIGVAFLPQYIFLFSVGILAHRLGWLPDLPSGVRRTWSMVAILAIIALPIMMVLGGDIPPFLGGLTWQSAMLSTWEAVYCVSMSILMLSLFRARFDFQGSLARFLSRNAYTVYIIHPVVIIPLAYFLRGISIDPLIKFILISPVAVALCFLVSHIVRRIPHADQVL
jgi:glucans biosynthesis protein C